MPTANDPLSWIEWSRLAVALAGGFFLSGLLAFRALPSPVPLATSCVGSLLLLFGGSLFLHATGLRITFPALACLLTIGAFLGLLLARATKPKSPPVRPASVQKSGSLRDLWWLAPLAPAVASVLIYCAVDPLSGWDNSFRWDYLAHLFQEQGSFAHYPPVDAEDFLHYPWSDGIPPLIPLLNLWLYFATGSSQGGLILGRVVVELGLTLLLVWRVASLLHGRRGGGFAVAALATSALFLWSVMTMQETGMTGVLLLVLAALHLDYIRSPRPATAIWLGLTAGTAALVRDYHLLYVAVVPGLLALAGASWRIHGLALSAAAGVAAPWYIRNAWLTGNPLFSHDLGGLLPGNSFNADYMRLVREDWSLLSHFGSLPALGIVALAGAGLLVALALPGLRPRKDPRMQGLALILLAATTLPILALGSTGGGWVYGLRVFGPALPLCAVAAGWWGEKISPRFSLLAGLVLLAPAIDASRRAWTFVQLPALAPWPVDFNAYRALRKHRADSSLPGLYAVLAKEAAGRVVVVDHPGHWVAGRQAGVRMTMLFSPALTPLTEGDAATSLDEDLNTLRGSGVRFVLFVTDATGKSLYRLDRLPGPARLLARPPTFKLPSVLIYDLDLPPGPAPDSP